MIDLQLPPQFRQVPLGNTEDALDRLWREVSESSLATGGTAVSRNTTLTLVAYTTTPAHARIALAAIAELTAQYPARAIIVVPEPDQPTSQIDVQVAIHSEGSGANAVYGEEILLHALGDAAHHIPGAVLPLVVAGLPAFLMWTGDPPWGSTLLETLVDGSDRLILDSCDMTDIDRSLAAAADLVRRKHTRCALSDFDWTRQTPWRELTAQFFDAPEFRPYLAGIDRVTIEYAAGDEEAPTNSAQAYLFAGWLASRLAWTLPTTYRRGFGPSRQHTLHDGKGRPVLVEVNARFGTRTASWFELDQPGRRDWSQGDHNVWRDQLDGPGGTTAHETAPVIGHGALMSVRIHALTDRRPGTFIVARDQDLAHATTLSQVDSGAPPSHTVHLASLGETALLHSQLELLGHDPIYEDALTTAARLVGYDTRRSVT